MSLAFQRLQSSRESEIEKDEKLILMKAQKILFFLEGGGPFVLHKPKEEKEDPRMKSDVTLCPFRWWGLFCGRLFRRLLDPWLLMHRGIEAERARHGEVGIGSKKEPKCRNLPLRR